MNGRAPRRRRGPRPGAALAAALLCAGCADGGADEERARLSLTETLAGADTAGYARALEPRPFDFPADHGPHPGFRTEWWYVTGNLTSDDALDFGFQLTIFRSALAADAPETESAWGTNQAYMAHFTLTDIAAGRFHAFERFARGAVGLAGATAEPLRVWVEDWSIEGYGASRSAAAADTAAGAGEAGSGSSSATVFPLRLHASENGISLDLVLERGKPPVPQGERGLSQKGPEVGNASYYFSLTRMPAAGTLVVDGDTARVRGTAWLDREWSTSALAEGQVGWDWFALQLDDGWEMMIYRLRRADGSADPRSDGVLISPEGARVRLAWGTDVSMEATGSWVSPIDGTVYPSGWRIQVPERGWVLVARPRIPHQELDVTFRYWEGAVAVEGTGEGGQPVRGRGYVELTGYAGELPERQGLVR